MTLESLKRKAIRAIDRHADWVVATSREIEREPETGFRETRAARRVAEFFSSNGIEHQAGLAITGVNGWLRGRESSATVAIIGELDALVLPEHPYSNPSTHAAHACGHRAQVAAMLGAGLGLLEVRGQLDGDIVLFATPAEEVAELDRRLGLRKVASSNS